MIFSTFLNCSEEILPIRLKKCFRFSPKKMQDLIKAEFEKHVDEDESYILRRLQEGQFNRIKTVTCTRKCSVPGNTQESNMIKKCLDTRNLAILI